MLNHRLTRLLALLTATVLPVIGLAAAVGPAEAVAPVSVTSKPVALLPLVHTATSEGDLVGNVKTVVDGKLVPTGVASALASFPFNGFKYNQTYICQDDHIGGGVYYPTIAAGNAAEAGESPIVLANDNNETLPDCQNYTDAQTLEYHLYNTAVQSCWKVTGTWSTINTWHIWTHSEAAINVYPSFCGDTAQHRASSVSRVTGAVLGLIAYGPTGNGDNCIMNAWYVDVYYYMGTCETGRAGWLY